MTKTKKVIKLITSNLEKNLVSFKKKPYLGSTLVAINISKINYFSLPQ